MPRIFRLLALRDPAAMAHIPATVATKIATSLAKLPPTPESESEPKSAPSIATASASAKSLSCRLGLSNMPLSKRSSTITELLRTKGSVLS